MHTIEFIASLCSILYYTCIYVYIISLLSTFLSVTYHV